MLFGVSEPKVLLGEAEAVIERKVPQVEAEPKVPQGEAEGEVPHWVKQKKKSH